MLVLKKLVEANIALGVRLIQNGVDLVETKLAARAIAPLSVADDVATVRCWRDNDGLQQAAVLDGCGQCINLGLVELPANLRDYIGGKRPHADIVVLRLEGEGLTEDYFRKVRGLMLDHVKSGYDFGRVMRLGLSAMFGARLVSSKIKKGSRGSMKDAVVRTRRRLHTWVPPQFICSGFIQYGLAKAAELKDITTNVMLKDGISPNDRNAILAVTPEDVARSQRLTWLYAIRRGWVYRVGEYDAALKVLE